MIYVFDTSPLINIFKNYYPRRFPSLWKKFNELVNNENLISCRENYREIEERDDNLFEWAKNHEKIFKSPSAEEGKFISQIYSIPLFRDNIEQQKLLKGGCNADPFVVAKAKSEDACVVTLEKFKSNSPKIPNICGHFKIECLDLEGFME